MAKKTRGRRKLIFGKRKIALRAFGDDARWRTIPSLMGELPIFKMGGHFCAYEDALDDAMAAKEQAAMQAAE
jgi:hypothetical protein